MLFNNNFINYIYEYGNVSKIHTVKPDEARGYFLRDKGTYFNGLKFVSYGNHKPIFGFQIQNPNME